jgi:hypothetical protein
MSRDRRSMGMLLPQAGTARCVRLLWQMGPFVAPWSQCPRGDIGRVPCRLVSQLAGPGATTAAARYAIWPTVRQATTIAIPDRAPKRVLCNTAASMLPCGLHTRGRDRAPGDLRRDDSCRSHVCGGPIEKTHASPAVLDCDAGLNATREEAPRSFENTQSIGWAHVFRR